MTSPADAALPLPGLEALPRSRAVGDVERGVRRTIAALDERDQLGEIDAGKLAVAIALSRIISKKEASGRLSTVSNDARLLVELLEGFTDDEALTEVDEKLRKLMTEWSDYADHVEADQAGP